MKVLCAEDVEQVGGALQAVFYGVIGAYVYDAAGGKEGIDDYIEDSVDSAKASFRYWKRTTDRFIEEMMQ